MGKKIIIMRENKILAEEHTVGSNARFMERL